MRTRFITLVLGFCALVALSGAAQSGDAALQLEAARRKAVIDGDHAAAVRDYQAIADRYQKSDPAVAAAALLLLAEAHESVADPRATTAYARLVSEHPDREEAGAARERLAQEARAAARTQRPIWEGQGASWSVRASADGRYLAYVDGVNLSVRDLTEGTNQQLTHSADSTEFAEGTPVVSRDGFRVAYVWYLDSGNRSELRVIDRRNPSAAPKTLTFGPDTSYVRPLDWFPGADRLVVRLQRRDRTAQIGLVSLADGAYQSLKSIDWRGPSNLEVSPNGQFIAYDLPISDTSRDREVHVLRVDGSRAEQRVSDRPGRHSVVGWTPDGRMVLFATERSGTIVLQGTDVTDGATHGPPRVVEPDMGAFEGSRGVANDGRLLFTKKVGGINVFTAEIDFVTGAVVSAPEQLTESVVSDHRGVMWSPDGRHLAYVSSGSAPALVIRSMETGATREIAPPVTQIVFPRWTSPAFITFQGGDFKGRQGIFRTDVQTGETTPVSLGGDGSEYRSWADATPDGRLAVYGRGRAGLHVIDLATGQERTIVRAGPFTGTKVSPDGSMVAYRTGDGESSSLMVVPIAGGEPRSVFTTTEGLAHFVQWLPDGERLVGHSNGKLIVVRRSGGVDREIEFSGGFGPNFVIHPDGRRIAFSDGAQSSYELWTLENFLPAPSR